MDSRSKPRHELCVDKTSCKSEAESRKKPLGGNTAGSTGFSGSAGHLTKNTVKQQYVQSQQQNETK